MPEVNSINQADQDAARRKAEFARLANIRQYTWYFFALGIYLFCAAAGFAIAYFVVRFLIYMKLH